MWTLCKIRSCLNLLISLNPETWVKNNNKVYVLKCYAFFVYLVYFSRSPFGEGGKRIQSNVLLASHHWENKMTSLLFQFFFFLEVLFFCRRDCMFPGDYFIFKNVTQKWLEISFSISVNYLNNMFWRGSLTQDNEINQLQKENKSFKNR